MTIDRTTLSAAMHRPERYAGLALVLAMHAAVLWGLWHTRILPPPTEAATLFVDLLNDPPKPEPPKPEPPKPQPVKLEKHVEPPPPQQLVAQAPVVLPTDPVAPPPPPVPQPVIEAPVEPAPLTPPKPAGPVMLSGELALSCPERTPPAYPSLSRRLGEEGKAILRVELNESGAVDRASVKTSSGYARLDDAALTAVKRWHCNPAKRDDIAVRAVAIQPFNFVLEGR